MAMVRWTISWLPEDQWRRDAQAMRDHRDFAFAVRDAFNLLEAAWARHHWLDAEAHICHDVDDSAFITIRQAR